jgi:hypothetical protein
MPFTPIDAGLVTFGHFSVCDDGSFGQVGLKPPPVRWPSFRLAHLCFLGSCLGVTMAKDRQVAKLESLRPLRMETLDAQESHCRVHSVFGAANHSHGHASCIGDARRVGDVTPNFRSSGRAVNKVPVAMLRRAAQLWR